MGIFRKKVEFEDEKRPLPDILKIAIIILFLVVSYVGTYELVKWMEKADMKRNNPTEYVYEEEDWHGF